MRVITADIIETNKQTALIIISIAANTDSDEKKNKIGKIISQQRANKEMLTIKIALPLFLIFVKSLIFIVIYLAQQQKLKLQKGVKIKLVSLD
jgi:hypothetical protein